MAKLDWRKTRKRDPDPATVIEPSGYERPSNWKPPAQVEADQKQRLRDEAERRNAAIAENERLKEIDWETKIRSRAKMLRKSQLQGKSLTVAEERLVSRWMEARSRIWGKSQKD